MTPKPPVTAAVRALRAAAVAFDTHTYAYVERGGTASSSAALGVPEHHVIKTLIFETGRGEPLCVLMHGDRKVSTKELARQLGEKLIRPSEPTVAERHSGYQVGGTSAFGLRRAMPIYVERSVLALPRIWMNGGKRGFLVSLAPAALTTALGAVAVDVAIDVAN
jgi:Cys-tRNA(Pro) deacylase